MLNLSKFLFHLILCRIRPFHLIFCWIGPNLNSISCYVESVQIWIPIDLNVWHKKWRIVHCSNRTIELAQFFWGFFFMLNLTIPSHVMLNQSKSWIPIDLNVWHKKWRIVHCGNRTIELAQFFGVFFLCWIGSNLYSISFFMSNPTISSHFLLNQSKS